jgi:interferon-induced GTP-binding protein Mx1
MDGMPGRSLGISGTYEEATSSMLAVIDDMRAVGAQHFVELPTIVVCGNQSAGKSSLLEAICGIKLPRSSGERYRFSGLANARQ